MYTGMSGGSTMVRRYLSESVINTNTGEVFELSKKVIRKILADEPDLLKAFEDEKNKKSHLSEYIIV